MLIWQTLFFRAIIFVIPMPSFQKFVKCHAVCPLSEKHNILNQTRIAKDEDCLPEGTPEKKSSQQRVYESAAFVLLNFILFPKVLGRHEKEQILKVLTLSFAWNFTIDSLHIRSFSAVIVNPYIHMVKNCYNDCCFRK